MGSKNGSGSKIYTSGPNHDKLKYNTFKRAVIADRFESQGHGRIPCSDRRATTATLLLSRPLVGRLYLVQVRPLIISFIKPRRRNGWSANMSGTKGSSLRPGASLDNESTPAVEVIGGQKQTNEEQ